MNEQEIDGEIRTRAFFKTLTVEHLERWIHNYQVGLGLAQPDRGPLADINKKKIDPKAHLFQDHMKHYMERGLRLAKEELDSRAQQTLNFNQPTKP